MYQRDWNLAAAALTRYDRSRPQLCPEAIVERTVQHATATMPTVAALVRYTGAGRLTHGGHGDPDIKAVDATWGAEVKIWSQENAPKRGYADGCPLQLGHLAHADSNLCVITSTRRIAEMREAVGHLPIVHVVTLAELADAIAAGAANATSSPLDGIFAAEK